MKYRVEIWINNGTSKLSHEGKAKQKLLKWAKEVCRNSHYENILSTSSVTLYEGDKILEDWFLHGFNTRFRRIENE